MFLGLDCFSDENSICDNTVVAKDLTVLELGNGKFDEIYITRNIEDTENKQDNTWVYGETIFTTHFDNSIFAGNLSSNLNIGHIKIKRKNIEDAKIEDLKILPYIQDKKQYEYTDNFVESLEQYEYSLQPIATNGALGISQSEVSDMVDFEGAYLITEEEILPLFYNLEVDGYSISIPSSVNDTLGSVYPYVMTEGLTKYKSSRISCMIMSEATSRTGKIDRKEEKRFRERVFNFITDKRPKVYKDSSGEYMVIAIVDKPELIPINELSRKIYNLSFNFVQVGGKDLLKLHHTGIIK